MDQDENSQKEAELIYNDMAGKADDLCRAAIDLIGAQQTLAHQQALAMILVNRMFCTSFMMAFSTGGNDHAREWMSSMLAGFQESLSRTGVEVDFNYTIKDA